MSKFQNFGRPPRAARPSGPVFFGRGPKLKILLPMFCLPPCPNSEKVRHSPPALNPPEEIDLAETHFFGVRPQGPSHLPKNYLQRVKWALKISRGSVQLVKSYDTFLKWHTDGRTDGQTKTNHLSTTTELFFLHICEGETLQTLQNFYLFTLWRIIFVVNIIYLLHFDFPFSFIFVKLITWKNLKYKMFFSNI